MTLRNTAMTDFIYTSPAYDLGWGGRSATVSKELCSYPASNLYNIDKNDKIKGKHLPRTKISVRKAQDKERNARRKKDRPQEEEDAKIRQAPSIIHPDGKSPEQSEYDPNNYQNVYTLGMDERDNRRVKEGPGPGSHEVKTHNWRGPPFKKGDPAKESVVDRDHTGPSSYNIVLKSRAPKYSIGSKGGAGPGGIGYRNRGNVKDTGPGPGHYSQKDIQFKKPTTKFSKAAKQSLAKLTGPHPSVEFDPLPAHIESDKYSFPLSKRFDDTKASDARQPGPGEYEILNQLSRGQHKSMLGGSLDPPQIKDNGVPGPGNYFVEGDNGEYLNRVPGGKISKFPERFKENKTDDDERAKNYKEKMPTSLPYQQTPGWSIGKGERDPMKSKFETPGPDAYDVTEFASIEDRKGDDKDKNKDKKYKFHMGMRTNYKANRGQDTPGPADYELDIYKPNSISHIISTGARSDLGVGKAHLAPGPGEYDIRGRVEGPQIRFGNEQKDTKIKKTYEPGPANYDLPSTVGNIPKYLRVKQERLDADRFDDKSENIELL
mmetsp:Transcript_21203/g.18825  ORF Transcript_21203/g.18825 Transcript_21203/m.18825 type:complete len:546 (+) Transcript_21203:3-1640(+)